ncbi:hypothetical protein A4U94_03675 [Prescottella equi]|uniref:hypothetical protein n=1 Tax=Rhodococcus hoagii TaxID=43767 RepID=UPI0009C0EB9D|nr:hypothetical protein [Prescottella equi]OQQ29125.1 hypothetical protein A4U94_03675 [Prescottella equi]
MAYEDDESHVERFRNDEGDVDIDKLRTEFAFTGDDMGDADADQDTDSADGETDSSDTEPTVDDLRATTFELEAQLRVATNECDFLRSRLDIYERREAEQAATRLADPKDLWVAGIELDDLRGTDGTIDADKVTEAATRVIAEHPGWAKRRAPLPDRRQGGGQREHAGGSVEAGRMTYLERKRNKAS